MFNNTFKYKNESFERFREHTVCSYEYVESLVFVYLKGTHIASYNTKTEVLDTDREDLFLD